MPLKNWHSARLKEPEYFRKDGFKTLTLSQGLQKIRGVPKGKRILRKNYEDQSIRFNARMFPVIKAKKWLRDHNIQPIKFEPAVKNNPDKLYRDFLGREAASEFDIDLGEMKKLVQLGKVHAIEYKARKHNDKRQQIYRHVFKQKGGILLLTNGKDLIIYGDIEINERGII